MALSCGLWLEEQPNDRNSRDPAGYGGDNSRRKVQNVGTENSAEMCGKALRTAERTAEKKLVLNEVIGLEKYASPQMLELALEAKKDPELRDDATRIAAAIAKKLGRN